MTSVLITLIRPIRLFVHGNCYRAICVIAPSSGSYSFDDDDVHLLTCDVDGFIGHPSDDHAPVKKPYVGRLVMRADNVLSVASC